MVSELSIKNIDVGKRFVYFTIRVDNKHSQVTEEYRYVTYDRKNEEWSCTCVHGSVFRFRKENPGVCRHINYCVNYSQSRTGSL